MNMNRCQDIPSPALEHSYCRDEASYFPDGDLSIGATRVSLECLPQPLFVGGLPAAVTEEQLTTFIERYGAIANLRLMRYPNGKSRGFAFVTFLQESSSKRLLQCRNLTLQGKQIECKQAVSKEISSSMIAHELTKKIYVGNIPISMPTEDVKLFFSRYGSIQEVKRVFDIESGIGKGFCFVVFKDPRAANAALASSKKYLNNILIYCKPALSKMRISQHNDSLPNQQFSAIHKDSYNHQSRRCNRVSTSDDDVNFYTNEGSQILRGSSNDSEEPASRFSNYCFHRNTVPGSITSKSYDRIMMCGY